MVSCCTSTNSTVVGDPLVVGEYPALPADAKSVTVPTGCVAFCYPSANFLGTVVTAVARNIPTGSFLSVKVEYLRISDYSALLGRAVLWDVAVEATSLDAVQGVLQVGDAVQQVDNREHQAFASTRPAVPETTHGRQDGDDRPHHTTARPGGVRRHTEARPQRVHVRSCIRLPPCLPHSRGFGVQQNGHANQQQHGHVTVLGQSASLPTLAVPRTTNGRYDVAVRVDNVGGNTATVWTRLGSGNVQTETCTFANPIEAPDNTGVPVFVCTLQDNTNVTEAGRFDIYSVAIYDRPLTDDRIQYELAPLL